MRLALPLERVRSAPATAGPRQSFPSRLVRQEPAACLPEVTLKFLLEKGVTGPEAGARQRTSGVRTVWSGYLLHPLRCSASVMRRTSSWPRLECYYAVRSSIDGTGLSMLMASVASEGNMSAL